MLRRSAHLQKLQNTNEQTKSELGFKGPFSPLNDHLQCVIEK